MTRGGLLILLLWALAWVASMTFSRPISPSSRATYETLLRYSQPSPPTSGQLYRQVLAVEYLSLRDLATWSSLPPELSDFANLRQLSLSRLPLTELPPTLGRLHRLQYLDASYTHLQTLPAQIGQLRHLQYLYLNHTHLRHLPPEIGQLRQLQVLNLAHTTLTDLPNLRGLALGNTPIQALPPALRPDIKVNLSGTSLEGR
jgi:Leucine-rich repeat (LRR) protein